ncbi:MAG: Fructose-bisphosphate aldolase [Candidatus Woesebacteria bacterium GW2011_GWA2_40_7b]|uniref:fructose-bisphosphate aldolase n=1 Tax=Candidatus Woesebacteria bacterium GW2011_GWA2_40_7b TaxID=1618563 RepID=A0A0G0VGU4_9BACT|nr:MAG: Fructose-bisphosphate aldolase [Candidatus Woesebacteria bacterium GW2011_GWA2_40_7b]
MSDPISNQPVIQLSNIAMQETIQKLLASGKGILAADARIKSMGKRLEAIGVEPTPENALKFRGILFATPGIVKVDEGIEPFGEGEEEITKGLETLPQKLKEYSGMGLKATKWRGVIKISDIYPTEPFLEENFGRMIKYAKLCQDNAFVPIVEPEILLDGNHTTTRCEEVETKVLKILFEKLKSGGVDLTKLILKTSMVLPGKDSGVKAAPLEVANVTLRTLKAAVPSEVPGIIFLSGGQTPDQATDNLNEISKLKGDVPWQISFSYERALQEEAMTEWAGKDENIVKAQEAFYERVRNVSAAREGRL